MRILVDLNHPAHVHLFKHAIWSWQKRGDEVLITARDKDLTHRLLDQLGLNFVSIPPTTYGLFGYIKAVLISDWRVWQVAREFNPDFLIGTSFAAAHVSKLVRGRSVVFGEDGFATNKQFWRLVIPFADFIVTPDSIPETFGRHHFRYAGCQELAYLHPDRFQPGHAALPNLLGPPGSYSLVRFVSLGAYHDKGERGISTLKAQRIINLLEKYGKVFVTSEGQLDPSLQPYQLQLPPELIHSALASARILVSDSQSMTIEAALLGTPSIRINSFAGRIPVIEELEQRYNLTFGFLPSQAAQAEEKITEILQGLDPRKAWQSRLARYLEDKVDLTAWMLAFLDEMVKN